MKKLILTFALISMSAIVNASYLYWQVTPSMYTAATWDTATVYMFSGTLDGYPSLSDANALDNVGYVDNNNTYKEFSNRAVYKTVAAADGIAYVADLGSFSSSSEYSYFVELSNSETGQRVAFSTPIASNNDAAGYVYANTGDISVTLSTLADATPWHAGGYGPVPEPTSAVLMLFGAAFLGLKRKNRSVA